MSGADEPDAYLLHATVDDQASFWLIDKRRGMPGVPLPRYGPLLDKYPGVPDYLESLGPVVDFSYQGGLDERVSALVPAQRVPALMATLRHADGAFRIPNLDREDAELFWLDPNVTALTLDAAPGLTSFHWSVTPAPARHGTVIFARCIWLVAEVVAEDTDFVQVPLRGIDWSMKDSGTSLSLLVDTDARGLGVMATTVINSDAERHFDPGDGKYPLVQPDQVLAAAFMLMGQPGVTEETQQRASGPPPVKTAKGRRKKAAYKPPPVRVVTLRAGSDNARFYDEASGKGRAYRHRWVVRGHTRMQPFPSLGEGVRKPVWIAPYLKGPADAPLLTTPKVTAVRAPKP